MSDKIKSDIFDKNGIEVKVGDTICLPYISPSGHVTETVESERDVVFKFGCFGYFNEIEFVPLINWMEQKEGDYVPNEGNKTIYTGKYLFWVKNK